MVATAPRPGVKKPKGTNQNAYIISFKAEEWGRANGHGDLLDQVAAFIKEYRAVQPPKANGYYESQTPERLLDIITVARRRLDKAMAALSAKNS